MENPAQQAQDPGGPGQPASGQPGQFAIGVADTVEGQRVAILAASGLVSVTILLTAAEAMTAVKQIADTAASMSTTGLVVATGVVPM